MKINRNGSAAWSGGIKDGIGSISTESGALKAYPYGFASRFEGRPGSNPEELLGAAHAGCFSMALSHMLAEAGTPVNRVHTTARVQLDKVENGFAITRIDLNTEAEVPGIDAAAFQKHAEAAKAGCPVSKALAGAEIHLTAKLL